MKLTISYALLKHFFHLKEPEVFLDGYPDPIKALFYVEQDAEGHGAMTLALPTPRKINGQLHPSGRVHLRITQECFDNVRYTERNPKWIVDLRGLRLEVSRVEM